MTSRDSGKSIRRLEPKMPLTRCAAKSQGHRSSGIHGSTQSNVHNKYANKAIRRGAMCTKHDSHGGDMLAVMAVKHPPVCAYS